MAGLAGCLLLAGCSDSSDGTEPSDPTTAPAPLAWEPVAGGVDDTVTTNGRWTLTVGADGDGATLSGPDGTTGTEVSARERVSDGLLDDDWAVVVVADRQETRPARAEVTELATGETWTIDGRSEVPTTAGGTWAMGAGRLAHATVSDDGGYCLAEVDLATRSSSLGWCAPDRHGFNGARVTAAGTALMTFDDGRPSCRTVGTADGSDLLPFEDVTDCRGWDALVLDDGSQVWSVVPRENQVETARFAARAPGGEVVDLGTGTSGTLVACGGAAWFARDPLRDGDPAALVRWTPEEGASTAYETDGGPAFLAAPRCGGSRITVTALAEGGDEQVSAPVG
ncbi:hypothetical protein [Nocardioides marmotae]|uniref:hypothetical protein n=1 Tax=Nocardioides marmotae TaxID=2663857 RepID=UPI0012B60B4C|nr:hypothetical protein [Nocardioides marmotae]MBC9732646.1 hypothetical protein [Nocardioides marmotae]MTB83763.1 hypothetical protein [Nocardioides marmotae]